MLAAASVDPSLLDTAARLLGAAQGLRDEVGADLPPVRRRPIDDVTNRVRAVLGDRQFEQAWKAGLVMTADGTGCARVQPRCSRERTIGAGLAPGSQFCEAIASRSRHHSRFVDAIAPPNRGVRRPKASAFVGGRLRFVMRLLGRRVVRLLAQRGGCVSATTGGARRELPARSAHAACDSVSGSNWV